MARLLVVTQHPPSCHCPECEEIRRSTISIGLIYRDVDNDLQQAVKMPVRKSTNLLSIVVSLLDLCYLDEMVPADLSISILPKARQDQPRRQPCTLGTTVEDLQLDHDDILCFSPTHPKPLIPMKLKVVGPDEEKKVEFTWYKPKTTPKDLMDFIIKEFSLEDIGRHRIHLSTYLGEMDMSAPSSVLLADLGITNDSVIYVEIFGGVSSITTNEEEEDGKTSVIASAGNGAMILFDISRKATINELRKMIEEKVNSTIFDLNIMYDKQTIDTSDLARPLHSFGIEKGRSIFALFSLKKPKSKNTNRLPDKPLNNGKVTIVVEWKNVFQLSIPMSVETSIGDLAKFDGLSLQNDEKYIPIRLRTDNGDIHLKNNHHCLADYGIESGEKLYLEIAQKGNVHSSIVGSSSSVMTRKLIKVNREHVLPLGLANLGNTCYMNSSFQCLARIPPLTRFFIDKVKMGIENERSDPNTNWNPFDDVGIVTGNYANLLWNLLRYNDENDDLDSIEATNMRDIVGYSDDRFNYHDQQDAQEFIHFLLQSINREIKYYSGNQPNTIIKDLFFGQMLSTVTCTTCNHEESTATPINFLSLPLRIQERKFCIQFITIDGKEEFCDVTVPMNGCIKDVVWAFTQEINNTELFRFTLVVINGQEVNFENSLEDISTTNIIILQQDKLNQYRPPDRDYEPRHYSLYECFGEFLSAESLENQWICPNENCGRKELAKKQLKFTALPSILVIHFKRFSHVNGVRVKVETHVDFPIQGLDLSHLVSRSTNETKYDLVAVCNHYGGMFGGHYTATTRCEINGQIEWFHFDDAFVKRIDPHYYLDEIVTRDAYLLFYVRRDLLTSNSEHSTLC